MRKATEKEIKKEITCAYCRYCKKDYIGQFYCEKENKYFYPCRNPFLCRAGFILL